VALTIEQLRDRVGLAVLGALAFWVLGLPVMAWQGADLQPYLRLLIVVPAGVGTSRRRWWVTPPGRARPGLRSCSMAIGVVALCGRRHGPIEACCAG